MSLKQECIDIIKLIIEPLRQEEYDFYDLEVDSIRDICERTGEDITYSDCQGCDNYGKSCPYKKFVQVDVSFWDGEDFQRNYIFSKKSSGAVKGLCYIKNRKQLMTEMLELKRDVEKYKNWCADFGESYSDYISYAKEFGEKLKEDYCLFNGIDTDILPVVCHTDFAKDKKGITDYTKMGNLCVYGKQNVINLYCCMEDVEETKRNIRHELIHYFLYISGLKYGDDTAIFHYFCNKYDANAYKEMREEEQQLHDKLVFAISVMENNYKELGMSEENFETNYVAMLFAAGSEKENITNEKLYDNGLQLMEIMEWMDKKKSA